MMRSLLFGALGGASLILGITGAGLYFAMLRNAEIAEVRRRAWLLLASSLCTILIGVTFLLSGWRSDLDTWLQPIFFAALVVSLACMAKAVFRRRHSYP
jgi:O-antigen/teichoic acid export membrane protein